MSLQDVRSISFDTCFLLRNDPLIDRVLKMLRKDGIPCFVTSTVISEMEQLKVWGRVSEREFIKGMSRWRNVNAKVIDFRNSLLTSALHQECTLTMEKYHGVNESDIRNDCNIIITNLKNGIDFFLSEDYHFTSRVTDDALEEMTSHTCTEFKQICGEDLYCLNAAAFVRVYERGQIDLEKLSALKRNVRKAGKSF